MLLKNSDQVRTIRLPRELDMKMRLIALARSRKSRGSIQQCMHEAVAEWVERKSGELEDAIREANEIAKGGRLSDGDRGLQGS